MSDEAREPAAEVLERTGSGAGAAPPATSAVWGWFLALLSWTAIVAFYDLNGGAGFEPTDCWVAQTAREMRENFERDGWTGLVQPQFSGETRLAKSPGAYWAVLATSYARGTPVDEAATRIPNGIAALLMVASIFWLTRRIAGDRAAVFAGFAASASLMVLYHSHRGSSDLGTAALMTASLACLWVACEHQPRGGMRVPLLLAGYFAAGLAMLYKMPMPLACIGLPVLVYLLLHNRWRVLADRWHILGIVLFLLPWLPWVIAVEGAQPVALAKWWTEFFDRFTGELPNVAAQRTDWKLYLLYVGVAFVFAAPFCLSIPGAIGRALASYRRLGESTSRRGTSFLLLWFLSLLAFFTVAVGKETRYFLPAMPPLLALLGIELAAFFDPRRPARPVLDRIGVAAVCVLVPGLWVAAAIVIRPMLDKLAAVGGLSWAEIEGPFVAVAGIFSAGAIVSALLYAVRREEPSFGVLVATMYVTWMVGWPTLMPVVASQAAFKDFAAQLRALPREQRETLRSIAQQDPRIIWYGDVRFPRLIGQLELLAMQKGRRDPAFEERIYAERMIDELSSDALRLFVIGVEHYLRFQVAAPPALAREGRSMPATYIWRATRVGRYNQRYLLMSNQPPPAGTEPDTAWLDDLLARARERHARGGAAEPSSDSGDARIDAN